MKIISKLIVFLILINGCAIKQKHRPFFDVESAEKYDWAREVFLLANLPKPAEGFQWVVFQGIVLQKPVVWSEHKTDKVYTSSVESVDKKGYFETGITVQRINNVKKDKKISVAEYAVFYIKIFEKDKNNKTMKLIFGNGGDSETAIYRYSNSPHNLKPIIVHKFIIANEKEDYVVIVTFEAPKKSWDQVWKKYGYIIMKNVVVYPF